MSDVHDAARRGFEEGFREWVEQIFEDAKANVGVGDPTVDPNPAIALTQEAHIVWHGPLACEIVFPGPYGAKQHEDQRLDHPRGGGAKYLERALAENAPRAQGVIAGPIRANLSSQRRR